MQYFEMKAWRKVWRCGFETKPRGRASKPPNHSVHNRAGCLRLLSSIHNILTIVQARYTEKPARQYSVEGF